MHLARVGVSEFPDLEIYHHKATQSTVKEDQIDLVPFIVNA